MPKVRFEIYSTDRGRKLIDLAEIMVEAGYLQSFDLDEEASEVIFNFEVNVGFDIEKSDVLPVGWPLSTAGKKLPVCAKIITGRLVKMSPVGS